MSGVKKGDQADENALCVFMAGPLGLYKGVNESYCACHNSRIASISQSSETIFIGFTQEIHLDWSRNIENIIKIAFHITNYLKKEKSA